MSAAPKPRRPASERRKALLAKVKIGQKALALDDDAYRAVLAERYRRGSAADLTDGQLADLVEHWRACGWADKPKRPSTGLDAQGQKIRALWRDLWLLAEVNDAGDRALDAFVARQTGTASLRFTTPAERNVVLETLKDWCARAGFAVPDTRDGGDAAMRKLVAAQWARLEKLGAVKVAGSHGLDGWLSRVVSPCQTALSILPRPELDRAAELLGQWLRREQNDGRPAGGENRHG